MSTTDALLLACSAAVTHDLLGARLEKASGRTRKIATIGVPWAIGLFAMYCAYDPPKLISTFYSAAIGLLSASLFVPLIAGIWYKRANTAGGVASLIVGACAYLIIQFATSAPKFSAVLFALAASALAMAAGSRMGASSSPGVLARVEELHCS